MTCKFCSFYQSNPVGIRGNTVFKMEKLDYYFTLYCIPFIAKKFQYTFFTFPSKECMTSLIKMHEYILFFKAST